MKTTFLKIGLFTLALLSFSQIDAQNKKKQKPEKMFAKIDTNKDGSVSLEEFKAQKVKKEIPAKEQEKRFTAMDTDANGGVNLEEYKAAIAKMTEKKETEVKKKPEKKKAKVEEELIPE